MDSLLINIDVNRYINFCINCGRTVVRALVGLGEQRALGRGCRRASHGLQWDAQHFKRRPRNIGLDEIPARQRDQFWTVISDIVNGEVLVLRQDRTEDTTAALLTETLPAAAVPHPRGVPPTCGSRILNAMASVLKRYGEVVFDKFHGRGKRWLLLRP